MKARLTDMLGQTVSMKTKVEKESLMVAAGIQRTSVRKSGFKGRVSGFFLNLALLCTAVVTVWIAAPFPVSAKETTATHSAKVMVYGDSLSAAYGLNPADGWVALMQNKLKPRGIEVVNASVSGETTRGGLSRIKGDLAVHKPNVVLLALGANDGLRGLPVADTRKNLAAMISAVKATNAKVVLIGIQIPPNYGLDYATQFRDLYADLAKQNKTALVPFLLEGVAEKLELFQPDRLHPIAAAQPRILENVLPTVEQILNVVKATPVSTLTAKQHARAAVPAR
jgi:acyl-CoA thioesterase I